MLSLAGIGVPAALVIRDFVMSSTIENAGIIVLGLHAYLAYVLVPAVILLIWLGGTT